MTTRPQGFSLAEVLILLALLAVGVLGLLSAQTYALQCANYNRDRHTATTLLESELNEARARLVLDFDSDPSHLREVDVYQPDFETTMLCSYAPTASGPTLGADDNLKQVMVAVYWKDRRDSNAERSISAWTLVYRVH